MNITLNLAVRQLEKYRPEVTIRGLEDRSFGRVHLWEASLSSVPNPDTLYVAALPTLLSGARALSAAHCVVCAGDPSEYARVRDRLPCSVVFVPGADHLAEVLNELVAYSFVLFKWGAALETIIASGESLQHMLDLSEPLLPNPIFIMTRTLQVGAWSRNTPIGHPDLVYAAEHGHFPDHMIRSIINNKWLLKSESFEKIGYHYPPNHINCTQITRTFPMNPLRLNTICMYGLNREPTPCDMDLMTFLAEQVLLFAKNARQHVLLSNIKDMHFIVEIIEGKTNRAEIESRAPLMKLNLTAKYRMYGVFFREMSLSDAHADYMQKALHALLPQMRILIYDRVILMLDDEDGMGLGPHKNMGPEFEEFLTSSNAYCAMSNAFTDLMGIRDAYAQVTAAAKLGTKYDPDAVLYSYETYYLRHILSCALREISQNALYVRELDNLIRYDRERGRDNLLLLETLLECERNITEVSKRMHLHRNSVLYRLDKIEKLLGRSLDDPTTRLNLLVSLKALGMKSTGE